MISTADLKTTVKLAALIYEPPAICGWDVLYDGSTTGGVYGAIKDIDAESFAIVLRGSTTIEDWIRDLKAKPYDTALLGTVDWGFYDGLEAFFAKVQPELVARFHKRMLVCGHSLGAARALLLGGLATQSGFAPDGIAAFAPPKPGRNRLAQVLDPIAVSSFRNGFDPVPELPEFTFEQPRSLIDVRFAPPIFAPPLVAWHSVALYEKAILKLP